MKPQKTEDQEIKNPYKQKILHFHNYNHIGLTIASQQIPNTGYFVLGMSLAHKEDQGSRFIGRNYALESLNEGMNDTDLDLHLTSMRDNMTNAVINKSGQPNCIRGQKGHYIVFGKERVIRIINYLRRIEHYAGSSKVNSTFHKAFFNLLDLYNRQIKYYEP